MNLFNIENAKKMTALLNATPEEVSPLTAEQQKILDAVNAGDWGCQDRSVRTLVAALTGIDCTAKPKGRPHVQGSMIVFDHETLLVTRVDSDGDAMHVTREGYTATKRGEGASYISGDRNWRAATEEEIDAFFN
jgi:hypothetical protein